MWVTSPGATIKPTAASSYSIVTVTAANVTLAGGGTLDGSGTTNPSSAGIYSFSATASDLTVEKLSILDTGGYGIVLRGRGRRFTNVRSTIHPFTAINLGPTTADISECEIIGNMIGRTTAGPATTYGNVFVAGTSGGLKIRRTKIHCNTVIMPLSPTASGGNMIGIEKHRGSIGMSYQLGPNTVLPVTVAPSDAAATEMPMQPL
jgi:hypothetical protein